LENDEARLAILAEWRKWVIANGRTNPNGMDGLSFFSDMSRDKPICSDFKHQATRGRTCTVGSCATGWCRTETDPNSSITDARTQLWTQTRKNSLKLDEADLQARSAKGL
jgi:hypothetical protein